MCSLTRFGQELLQETSYSIFSSDETGMGMAWGGWHGVDGVEVLEAVLER